MAWQKVSRVELPSNCSTAVSQRLWLDRNSRVAHGLKVGHYVLMRASEPEDGQGGHVASYCAARIAGAPAGIVAEQEALALSPDLARVIAPSLLQVDTVSNTPTHTTNSVVNVRETESTTTTAQSVEYTTTGFPKHKLPAATRYCHQGDDSVNQCKGSSAV